MPAVSMRRGRSNDFQGWPSLVRNLSTNASSTNADEGTGRQQQLGQGNVQYGGALASTVDAGQGPLISRDGDKGIDASNTVAAPSAQAEMTMAQPPHTVVEHPPAPGWEHPPVPDGCEPKFAIIRLGNTQHKVLFFMLSPAVFTLDMRYLSSWVLFRSSYHKYNCTKG